MPVKRKGDGGEFKRKMKAFTDGLKEGLPIIGEIARDELVRSTLAGLGKDDKPFAPYSKSYAELIEAVGGKTSGVVDLRGIFWHKGRGEKGKSRRFDFDAKDAKKEARRQKGLLRRAAGRRAFIRVTIGKKSFFAQTKETRPRQSLEDKESEMSTDLIKVTVKDFTVTLTYTPRENDYMILHNAGKGKLPKREWFSLEKANIKGAVFGALQEMFKALVADFNASK